LASHPGLAIVNTIVTASGPGSASLAASWADAFGLTNVHVWGDTDDYFYFNFMDGPPFNTYYPGTIVIDVDTMTITDLVPSGTSSADSAIHDILEADHPCADY